MQVFITDVISRTFTVTFMMKSPESRTYVQLEKQCSELKDSVDR